MPTWKLVRLANGKLLRNTAGNLVRYDADLYPDGPPAECCCPGGCCDAETMPDPLDMSANGTGGCSCFVEDAQIAKATPDANQAWRYEGAFQFGGCGGLERTVDLWCQSADETTAEGWVLEEGKTYVQFHECHATDPVNPLDPDRRKPVEVTVLSCDPFHATVSVPLSDYSPSSGECNCEGGVDLEFTTPV